MENEIRKEDGRSKNSRPPLPDIEKKVPIVIYKRVSEIRTIGSSETFKEDIAKVRERLGTYFDEMLDAS